ncbi:MAG: putative ABC transporter permease, partial [Oscillospiraceae bacterium]
MYNLYDLGLYLLVYSFLGWAAEAGWYAVTRRKFCNRGVVALPLVLSYGFTFVLLLLVLPTLAGRHVLSFLATMVVSSVVEGIGDHFFRRVGPKIRWNQERSRLLSGTGKGLLASVAVAAVYYVVYLILHPVLMAGLMLVPEVVRHIVVLAELALVGLDFAAVFYAVRTGDASRYEERQAVSGQKKLAGRIYNAVWKRLQKAYPGLEQGPGKEEGAYTFAKG